MTLFTKPVKLSVAAILGEKSSLSVLLPPCERDTIINNDRNICLLNGTLADGCEKRLGEKSYSYLREPNTLASKI
jgi:hypothetical protein